MDIQRKYKYNTLRIIGVLCAVLLAGTGCAQQNVQFTQYMFNGLVINPAYAGAEEALSLTFIQRKQWANIENSPSTQSLSAHTLFKKKHLGLGFTLINDKIGVHKNLNISTSYAYRLKVGEASYFSMGIQAGVHNRKSNYGSLASSTNVDPKLYDAVVSYTAFDFGMGIYFRSPRFHFGVSAPELLPERFSLNDSISIRMNQVNFLMFTKYLLNLNESIDIEPSILLKYLHGVPLSFDLNMNFIYRKVLTLGMSYRKKESIDFMFKGQMTPQLQFGYSYDHPVGEVSKVSNGSHELMVNYVFRYVRSNVSSPR
jgi:type IX secretion system PorP/SprF family membrane protein